jgi:hypothetical protein
VSRLTGIAVMIVQEVFTYRQAIGAKVGRAIPHGELWASAVMEFWGANLDNHICFIITQGLTTRAFQWSDNELYECKKLVAGDCNVKHSMFTVLWQSEIHKD